MTTDERTIGDIDRIVDIPMGGKKNIILDATILSTLMNCPRLSDFRFNHNFVSIGGRSNSIECGALVHVFLEYFYGGIIQGIKRENAVGFGFTAAQQYIQGCAHCTDFTPSKCTCDDGKVSHTGPGDNMDVYELTCDICKGTGLISKPTCGHKPNEFPGLKNTPENSEGYKIGWRWVLDTCQQYVDFYRNDHWVPLEVEIVKGKILYEDDEIRILWKAKLDWTADTNQGIFPIDHKTMKQRRDNVSLNNQFMGQCLVMNTHNIVINKIGFQTSLKPEEKFERNVISYSDERLIEWQSETLPYYGKLLLMYAESGHFPPNYSNCESKYGKCAFIKVCESNPSMRNDVIKNNFIVGPVWNPTNVNDED